MRNRTGGRERWLGLLGIALLGAAWGLLVPSGHPLVPPLAGVVREVVALARDGVLLLDVGTSLARIVPGVALAVLLALFLAAVTTGASAIGHMLGGVVEVLRPIPPIAWIPVAILVFGIGSAPAVAIVTLGAFFPIWFGVRQGLDNVRSRHLQAAKSLGATRWILIRDVAVPSMLPSALHGLRLGVGFGWFCVVAAEMMGARSGLGYGVQLFSLNLELEKTYGYILVIGLLGASMNFLMRALEVRLTHWQDRSVMTNV